MALPTPDIALLIPCRDASRHMDRLMAEAAAQTTPFSEVIIYDDASSDDTSSKARAWGARVLGGGVRVGPGNARNRLLAAVKSRWLHFHDVDDPLAPNFVEAMAAAILSPGQGAICDYRIEWQDGSRPSEGVRLAGAHDSPDLIRFMLEHFVHLNAVVYPTALARQIGGFFPYLRYCEDRDFQVRMAHAGLVLRHASEVTAVWLRHGRSYMAATDLVYKMRYNRWFLHRCYRKLDPKYRPVLGDRAMWYAWDLYYRGALREARRCLRLAEWCGTKHQQNTPPLQRAVAHLFGPETMFRLRTLRARKVGRPLPL